MQPSKDTDLKSYDLNGKVKEMTIRSFEFNSGTIGRQLFLSEVKFDEAGYLTESLKWKVDAQGNPIEVLEDFAYTNQYEDGILVLRESVFRKGDLDLIHRNFTLMRTGLEEELIVYNQDGPLTEETVKVTAKTTYNHAGDPVQILGYRDGKLYQTTTFKYDKEGRLSEKLIVNESGKPRKILYKCSNYTSYGKCNEARYEDDSSEPITESGWNQLASETYHRRIFYKGQLSRTENYNKHFNLTESHVAAPDSDIMQGEMSNEYVYDSKGNWIEMKSFHFLNPEASYVIRRSIKYYE